MYRITMILKQKCVTLKYLMVNIKKKIKKSNKALALNKKKHIDRIIKYKIVNIKYS